MKSRRILWTGLAGMIVFAATAVLMYWQPWRLGEPELTAQAAEQAVLAQYPGKIEQIKLENGRYELQLRSESGLYQVALDASSGTIDSIRQIEAAAKSESKTLQSREQVKSKLQSLIEGKIDRLELIQQEGEQVYQAVIKLKDGVTKEYILDPYTGEMISSRDIQTPLPEDDKMARLLTEAEASKRALAKVPGLVDDVDLRGTDSGIPYYLIEIDLKDGREATVEVNAISGAIRSVTWDDDEPDEDI